MKLTGKMHFNFHDFVLDAITDPNHAAARERLAAMFPSMHNATINHILNERLVVANDQTDPEDVKFDVAAGIDPLTQEQLDSYKKRLEHHDWWYDYSDDHRMWNAGHTSLMRLEAIAIEHPMYALMFDIEAAYFWSDNPCTKEEYEQRMAALYKLELVT